MPVSRNEIQSTFNELLSQFLSGQNESILAAAYELGRTTLKQEIGELEVLRMYHQALIQTRRKSGKHLPLETAMDFLSEFLAPYEVRQRGYRGLIEELNAQNHHLKDEVELRKKAEHALSESKEYFQRLIENAQDIIIILNFDGRIQFASPSVESILGYKKEEILNREFLDFICEMDAMRLKEKLAILKEKHGNTVKAEFRIKHKNGSWCYLENIAQNLGAKTGIIVNSRDVSVRVVAHQKLQESESKLKSAQQMAHLGNWEWFVKEDIIAWSDELCAIFGLSRSQCPKTFAEYMHLLHPGERQSVRQTIRNALGTGEQFEYECRIIRPDGEIRHMYSVGNLVANEAGEIIKVIGTGQDITRMKETEMELRRYSKQLKNYMANEERTREEERIRIAREIHDELGQMLTVLKLDISMMLDEARNVTALEPEFLDNFQAIAKRIDVIVKCVQRIAKELRPDIFNHLGLEEALQWQAKEFEKRTGIKQVLKSEIQNLEILSDEHSIAIYRIFQEALTNILRHANATEVSISMRQEDEQLVLIVQDNGRGLDEEYIKTSNSLGIMGMRERSQLLKGSICFSGKKGEGTTVTLKIPLNEEQSANCRKVV